MSILSDISIIKLCTPPSHTLIAHDRPEDEFLWASLGDLEALPPGANIHPVSLEWAAEHFKPMIAPFIDTQVREVEYKQLGDSDGERTIKKIISKGVSSFGYDVTLGDEFKLFTNVNSAIIDPKRLDLSCMVDAKVQYDPVHGESYVIMPPNSYILGKTREWFDIPRDLMIICLGKSTYARAGAIINVTPIEAGFKGNVVIEISNATSLPMKIYVDEGIAQFLFLKGDRECRTSYADRGGKYQGQTGVTLPRV